MNWQEFEKLARAMVRNWGFQVGNCPQKRYSRNIDIVGPHQLIKKSVKKGLHQNYLEFIGECKAWNKPVDIDLVDEIVGLRECFIVDNIASIATIISKDGFTERAIQRAKKQDILTLDKMDIENSLIENLYRSEVGPISRKSFPLYDNFDCIKSLIVTISENFIGELWFSKRELWPILKKSELWKNKKGGVYDNKLVNDYLDVLALLGVINWLPNEKNRKIYCINQILKSSEFIDDNIQFIKEFMRYNILKLPWIREIILLLSFGKITSKTEIGNILENSAIGFDKNSIRYALKLAIDLEIINKNLIINNDIKKYLWINYNGSD